MFRNHKTFSTEYRVDYREDYALVEICNFGDSKRRRTLTSLLLKME